MDAVWPHLRSLIGLAVFCAIAWGLGPRGRIPWRLVLGGIGLQFALTIILYAAPPLRAALYGLGGVVTVLQLATAEGTAFVFGYVGGADPPFPVTDPGQMTNFAFQILPLILVVSVISALLWHWRILEVVVRAFAWLFRRTMGLSGAASLATAANIFIGMVEAPMLVRPRLKEMSSADLFLLMTVGLATVAGTVLALYAATVETVLVGGVAHVMTASIISAPAAVVAARLMHPLPDGREPPEPKPERMYHSSFDALVRGVEDGLRVLMGIVGMLLVVLALKYLVDAGLSVLPDVSGAPLTVERIFGWVFAPIMWLAGVEWADAGAAGALMGIKTALNELLAYLALPDIGADLSTRSRLITVYALCGFANFGSVGIMVGGLASIVPERREEIVNLGIQALVSGTLATLMTGAVVGALPMGLFGM